MKATGIVRRIDDLGRIVIPKEGVGKHLLFLCSSVVGARLQRRPHMMPQPSKLFEVLAIFT